MVEKLPEGYERKEIDQDVYDLSLKDSTARDFVSSFESKEMFYISLRSYYNYDNGKTRRQNILCHYT